MTQPLPVSLEESYRYCRDVVRESSSSFSLAFWLLPRPPRRAMTALYAFMRHTDDLVDGGKDTPANQLNCHDGTKNLRAWRFLVNDALRSDVTGGKLQPVGTLHPILPALRHTVRQYNIPTIHLTDVIDGVEQDLHCPRYQTYEQLAQYCQLVASAVGRACLYVWGFRDERALSLADTCGIAYQLTNILRDIHEDAGRGRIYLPLDDLQQFGVVEEELLNGTPGPGFDALMRFEIERTRNLYRQADALRPMLSPPGRRIWQAMTTTYSSLLEKIDRNRDGVLAERIRLTRWHKATIVAKSMVFA